jgi:uncharacterized protein
LRSLLDVNVLIALVDENHTFHRLSHSWFADHRNEGWASCPITENAVVRILAGDKYKRTERLTVQDVTEALRGFDQSTHKFWPDDITVTDARSISTDFIHGAGQLTDVYLLALAVKNNGRFVTFDQRIPLVAVPAANQDNLVVLVDR